MKLIVCNTISFTNSETNSVKYFGVLIDNNLTWKTHIQPTNLKLAKSIGVLSRLRHIVSKDILVSIYNVFIPPHITYSITNWGGTYTSVVEPVRKGVKQAVRVISFEPMKSHAQPLFKKLKLSCLDDCYRLECAKFMYEINNNSLEKQFCDMFAYEMQACY